MHTYADPAHAARRVPASGRWRPSGPTRSAWRGTSSRSTEPVDVIVHPTTDAIFDRPLTRMWEDPPFRPPVSQPWPQGFEFYGMRDYVPGDDPRRIVWTAAARTGQVPRPRVGAGHHRPHHARARQRPQGAQPRRPVRDVRARDPRRRLARRLQHQAGLLGPADQPTTRCSRRSCAAAGRASRMLDELARLRARRRAGARRHRAGHHRASRRHPHVPRVDRLRQPHRRRGCGMLTERACRSSSRSCGGRTATRTPPGGPARSAPRSCRSAPASSSKRPSPTPSDWCADDAAARRPRTDGGGTDRQRRPRPTRSAASASVSPSCPAGCLRSARRG